jgi:DNA-binding NarL/FixJ family response regulator
MTVLAFVSDFMFRSKIDAAARAVGASVAYARTGEAVGEACARCSPGLVVVDLGVRGFEPVEVIRQAHAARVERVVAFGSHVDAGLLARAREAGAEAALPRSAFSKHLPEILRGAAGEAADEGREGDEDGGGDAA